MSLKPMGKPTLSRRSFDPVPSGWDGPPYTNPKRKRGNIVVGPSRVPTLPRGWRRVSVNGRHAAMERARVRRVISRFALVAVALLALAYGGDLAAAADAPAAGANAGAPKAGPSRGGAKPGGKSASPARSDEPTEAKAASDLDDQLLEGTAPARRPMAKPPGPPAGTPPGKPADGKPAEQGAPGLAPEGESAEAEPSADDNPLAHVVAQMRAAQRRLESLRKGDADTKQLQDQIVAELADLIAQLEKQQSGQQSASNSAKRQSPSSASDANRSASPALPRAADVPTTAGRPKRAASGRGRAKKSRRQPTSCAG